MTTAEYLTSVGEDTLKTLVRNGIISVQYIAMLDTYRWHYAHGKDRELTAKQFGISVHQVSYAVKKMNQPII